MSKLPYKYVEYFRGIFENIKGRDAIASARTDYSNAFDSWYTVLQSNFREFGRTNRRMLLEDVSNDVADGYLMDSELAH